MKFIKTFEDFDSVSPELKAHIEEGLDLTNSFFRLGSEAYAQLFEEVKEYWIRVTLFLKDLLVGWRRTYKLVRKLFIKASQ